MLVAVRYRSGVGIIDLIVRRIIRLRLKQGLRQGGGLDYLGLEGGGHLGALLVQLQVGLRQAVQIKLVLTICLLACARWTEQTPEICFCFIIFIYNNLNLLKVY